LGGLRKVSEIIKTLAQAEANERNAQANLANTEAEKIRNAEIPKGLAETEQIKSQAALNLQRAATMKSDGINKRIVAGLCLGGGAWSLFTGQPYPLTLGLVIMTVAALTDISGILKQLKGKSTDKD
jgi:enterochelin esterase-like enzyme